MAHRSEDRFLVLHGLRVKGLAEVDTLVGVDAPEPTCKELEADGLVQRRDGLVAGWRLTAKGRAEHDRLVADELQVAGAREEVADAYRRFLGDNRPFLAICTEWQGERSSDVVDQLEQLHQHVVEVVDQLASHLDRFGTYRARFELALDRVRAGDTDYLTRPLVDSYHTAWAELHEDLLSTLGIARGSEEVA